MTVLPPKTDLEEVQVGEIQARRTSTPFLILLETGEDGKLEALVRAGTDVEEKSREVYDSDVDWQNDIFIDDEALMLLLNTHNTTPSLAQLHTNITLAATAASLSATRMGLPPELRP